MGDERGLHDEHCATVNDLICGKMQAANINVV
jgi:hypothetical protein